MNLVKSTLQSVYGFLVAGKEKAVIAAAVAFVASFVAQHLGHHISDAEQQVVVSVVVGALAHLGVYFTANTKKVVK